MANAKKLTPEHADLARLRRLLDEAEENPKAEIDGVPIHTYFQNEVDLYREKYGKDPNLRE